MASKKRKRPSPTDKDFERMANNIFLGNKWMEGQEDYELAFNRYVEDENLPKQVREKLLEGSYKYFRRNMIAKGVKVPTFRKKARVEAIKEQRKEDKDAFRFSGIQKTKDPDVPERVVFARKIFVTFKATGKRQARFIGANGRYVAVPKHLRGE